MFGEYPALQVLSLREAEKGMGRPGVAIGAAMFAAAIGVDRTNEAEIG